MSGDGPGVGPHDSTGLVAVAARERRQHALLLHMSDVLVVTTADGMLTDASPSASRILGYPDGSRVGTHVLDLVHPDDRTAGAEALRHIAAHPGPSAPRRLRLLLADGSSRRYEVRASNLLDDPEIAGIVMVASDVTEQDRVEHAQRGQARVLELIAAEAPVEVVLEALTLWVEDQVEGLRCTILLAAERPGGPVLADAASPSMPDSYREAVDGLPAASLFSPCAVAVRDNEPVVVEDLFADQRWSRFHELAHDLDVRACWSFPVRSPANGRVLGTFALYQSDPGLPPSPLRSLIDRAQHLVGITVDRHHLLQRLEHQANHDALTGLPNRTLLLERLSTALSEPAPSGPMVVFLDLDRLKIVNDSLGHELGDDLLVEIGQRLRAAVPRRDMVARFGGDEFVLLTRRSEAIAAPHLMVEHVLATIAEPVTLEGRIITPSASAGVVLAEPGDNATDVLRDADIAMYRAKHRGGSAYEIFDTDMRQRAFDRLDLEGEIRTGLAGDEFRVYYQPVVDLSRDDQLVGFEALVRWEHPERGLLGPAAFIDLAEETGLIVPLGAWVLRTAADTVRGWARRHAGPPLTLSVNLAAQQLAAPGLVDDVRAAMAAVAPWSLALELTESTSMDSTPAARAVIAELAETGVLMSIDDFGAGFSSLGYLTRLPVTTLKIDRSFVVDLETRPDAATVAASIISLGQALRLTVIAEGIETAGQRQTLMDMGCRYAQGYLFGRPVPDGEAEQLVARRNPGQVEPSELRHA